MIVLLFTDSFKDVYFTDRT